MARVLIVDDEASVRRSLGRVLADAGYECLFAGDTLEAIDRVRGDAPDLVLSDINMPGPSGLTLIQQVRQEHPDIAVVMVTAVDDADVGEQAIQLGAAGYLIKPFKPNEILVMVANALQRRQLEQAQREHTELLERTVAERTAELRLAHQQMLQRLAKAVEFRDDETAEHLQRMGRYCQLLGRHLGLSEEDCEQLRRASVMHDVGKINVPDAILLKPGALTAEEFEVMKQHSEVGYKLLSGTGAELLDRAATVAYTHHEKYDGTGYPRGLKGEEIPLDGRIAAVADVFDALTSRRVYRGPIPTDEAVQLIRTLGGSHFDPKIVAAFFEILPAVLKVHQDFADGIPDGGD